jgi:hypothetical protein
VRAATSASPSTGAPEAHKALHDDLTLLELRPRRGHDLPRTFITLAEVDGAREADPPMASSGGRLRHLHV